MCGCSCDQKIQLNIANLYFHELSPVGRRHQKEGAHHLVSTFFTCEAQNDCH